MELEPIDKRIDDLNSRMSEGFQLFHREFDGLDKRMTEGFKRVDGDVQELRGEIKKLCRETAEGFERERRETNEMFEAQRRETNERFTTVTGRRCVASSRSAESS